jgi:O-antigen/teichoic acid export membrane protein
MLRPRHVLSTGAASVIGGGLTLLLAFVAARLLTPTENGHYAQYLLAMNLVFILLNLGVGSASTYYLASGQWSLEETMLLNGVFIAMVAVVVALVSLVASVTAAGAAVERTFKIPLPVFYFGLGSGVLLLAINHVAAVLFGLHRYDRANLANVFRAGLPLPFVLAAGWSLSGGEMPVVVAHSGALVAVLAVALFLVPPRQHALQIGAPRRGRFIALVRYGGLVYVSNLLHFAAMRGLLLFITFYAAPEQVGYFSLALMLLEAMLLLPSAIGQLVLPQSSSSAFDRSLVESLLRVIVYGGLVLAVLCMLFAESLAALTLGRAYMPVGLALAHLAPAIVLLAVPRILSQLLVGQGHPGYPLAAAVMSTALGGLLALYWIPAHGINGAAWVSNVVALVTALVTAFGYCRIQQVSAMSVFLPRRSDLRLITRMHRRGAKAGR